MDYFETNVALTHRDITDIALVTAIFVGAAVVGLTLGRLLRDTLPAAPTARTSRAREYLYACHDPNMAAESRILYAFEAVYFCCVEIIDRMGRDVTRADHPDRTFVEDATRTLNISKADVDTILGLFEWRLYPIPSHLPPCTQEVAWAVARRIYVRTLRFLGT